MRLPLALFPALVLPTLARALFARATGQTILLWLAAGLLASLAMAAPLASPAGEQARLPRLSDLPGGGQVLSWVEPDGAGQALKFSVWKNGHWSPPGQVARGNDWFVNWADFPGVVPVTRSFWVAHWRQRQAGGGKYDYDVMLAVTRDAGKTWNAPFRP